MKRLLIADDEKFIRKGIRTILERSDLNLDEIIECANGVEALETMYSRKVDILITDIKMPKMNGIALLNEMKKLEEKPKIIILSGFDEFSYAQESIRHGVCDYLLKPVIEDELLALIRKLSKDIEENAAAIVKEQKLYNVLDCFKVNQLNSILTSRNIKEEDINDILEILEINIFDRDFFISSIYQKGNCRESNYDIDTAKNIELIERYLINLGAPNLCFLGPDNKIVMVTENSDETENILNYLSKENHENYIIGVSLKGQGVGDIREAYLQASEALKYKLFVHKANEVINYKDVQALDSGEDIDTELINKVSQIVGCKSICELDEILLKIFYMENLSKRYISYTEKVVEYFNKNVIDYLIKKIKEQTPEWEKKYENIKNIHQFDILEDYIHSIKQFLLEIHEYLMMLSQIYTPRTDIDDAIEFIRENYNKDLNMAFVANQVSMNYSYFSEMFKEKTGSNFLDFLKGVRIEKAKELLRNTDYKIFEVGEMVGFNNSKHFTKIFKEIIGISPIEYRNKII
jgi:two-component system response regulator YesN